MVAHLPAGLLLTGGASRRMGRAKATLVVDGQPLAQRTAALLRQVADPVIEVGPGYTSLARTCEDPPGSGPLAALVAGADALRGAGRIGPALVVATDLPRLSAPYLERIARYRAPSSVHSVVPRDAAGRPQPLCARFSGAALDRARELVAEGHRSMMVLLQAIEVAWYDTDDPAGIDVDTPGAFEAVTPG